jgi:hypothetical protein
VPWGYCRILSFSLHEVGALMILGKAGKGSDLNLAGTLCLLREKEGRQHHRIPSSWHLVGAQ